MNSPQVSPFLAVVTINISIPSCCRTQWQSEAANELLRNRFVCRTWFRLAYPWFNIRCDCHWSEGFCRHRRRSRFRCPRV